MAKNTRIEEESYLDTFAVLGVTAAAAITITTITSGLVEKYKSCVRESTHLISPPKRALASPVAELSRAKSLNLSPDQLNEVVEADTKKLSISMASRICIPETISFRRWGAS